VTGGGATLGSASLPAGICSQMSFGTWTPVPGSGAANGPPSWFLVDNPKLNTATGNTSLNIVGVAGYPGTYNYQTAVITLKPLNSFLLNVLWINYNQIDPAVVAQYVGGGAPTCTYYWNPPGGGADGLESGCLSVNFVSADTLSGNLFVNDTVFLCGSPTFQNVQTADQDQQWVQNCSGSANVTGTAKFQVPVQPIPSDNSNLAVQAAANGCVYEGPTTIVLNGTTMTVTSPGTPTGKPTGAPGTSSSNDPLNDPANTANVCVPTNPVTGGVVNMPTNGVIFVENCQAAYTSGGKCNGSSANPLSAAGETGVGGPTVGDAIVQGTISTPTIVGSANNIIIDGNLCYADAESAGKCTTSAPASPSTNILGLVALNYVELNHPVSGGSDVSSCSPSNSPTSGAVTCDLSNPIVDAVILALNHSFLVNSYNTGNTLGSITLNGTIDENWRGPVGTSSGSSIVTGYAKAYQYDPRLIYLSPPYYLNPGTSQWGFASFTVVSGLCKLPAGSPNTAQCTGYP